MAQFARPRLLHSDDDLSGFDCGVAALNDWLQRRALANHQSGASRCYVVVHKAEVIAYYCLAVGSIEHAAVAGKLRRNMPDPIPVVMLGRLAIATGFQGQGLGAALVQDALLRCIAISDQAGVRAMLVHAKDEAAAMFYKRMGFVASPMDGLVLLVQV